MIILGRDGMKILSIGLYALDDIKRVIYYHGKQKGHNMMPNVEDVNDLFNQIEYRHNGDPGIYKLNENENEVEFEEAPTPSNAKEDPSNNYKICDVSVATKNESKNENDANIKYKTKMN